MMTWITNGLVGLILTPQQLGSNGVYTRFLCIFYWADILVCVRVKGEAAKRLKRPPYMEDRSATATGESDAKRRRTDEPPSRGILTSSDAKTRQVSKISKLVGGKAPLGQISGINLSIEQAKNFAVAQAQQDGSTGNYRIFDSPYSNFLVPVVPTRAELAE